MQIERKYAVVLVVVFALLLSHGCKKEDDSQANIDSTESSQIQPESSVEMVYDMLSQGFRMGSVTVTRTMVQEKGQRTVEEKTVMKIKVDIPSNEYSLDSTETASIGPKGLTKYEGTFDENGTKSAIKAKLEDDNLVVRTRMGEGEQWLTMEFPTKGYDFTSSEVPPEERLKGGEQATLNWLSLYEMAVAKVKVKRVGKESIKVGNRTFDCEILTFDNKEMESSGKVWVAKDSLGPFLVKEDGREPTGPFTLVLTKYEKGANQ